MEKKRYTPAEVCEIFDISKSTLFRWEKEGRISSPDRDLRQQRWYTQGHMAEIGRLLFRRQAQQLANTEHQPGAEQRMDALHEQISLNKFAVLGDIRGLYELAERETLAKATIRQLLLEASRRDPSDEAFRWIVKRVIGSRIPDPDDSM
jgi:DNA-binding transcriptional MerR regulator